MAKTTIHQLAYKLLMDSSEYEAGAKITRRENAEIERTIQSLKTEGEKLEDQVSALVKAQLHGRITTDQFAEALRRLEDKTGESEKKLGGFAKFMKEKFVVTLGDAVGLVKSAIRGISGPINETIEKFTELDKTAKALDVSPRFIKSFEKAGALGGLTGGDTRDAFKRFATLAKEATLTVEQEAIDPFGEKFTRTIDKSSGKMKKVLEQLKIDPKTFGALGLEDQWERFGEAIRDSDEKMQLFAANEIFGDKGIEMLKLLKQPTADVLAKGPSTAKLEADIERAKKAQEAMAQLGEAVGKLKDVIVMQIVPLLTKIVGGEHGLAAAAETASLAVEQTAAGEGVFSFQEVMSLKEGKRYRDTGGSALVGDPETLAAIWKEMQNNTAALKDFHNDVKMNANRSGGPAIQGL